MQASFTRRPKESTMSAFRWTFRCGWAAVLLVVATSVQAVELKLVAPNAVKEAVTEIASRFEKDTGHRVVLTWGGSEAIAKRIADGEVFDVIVNTGQGLDRMTAEGRLAAGSRTDIGRSGVAAAVRLGAAPPDISTAAALKEALLGAPSIAISSGASGRYLEQLFQKLGVADQIRHKIRQPPSGAQIGEMLARGDAELGFQQVTELMHAAGVQYLGPLPAELQGYTVWAAGWHARAEQPDAARALVRALAAAESGAAIRRAGMEPL
jgi:molybdate transport system substrate-binding protein